MIIGKIIVSNIITYKQHDVICRNVEKLSGAAARTGDFSKNRCRKYTKIGDIEVS